jgi:hypothetical protein
MTQLSDAEDAAQAALDAITTQVVADLTEDVGTFAITDIADRPEVSVLDLVVASVEASVSSQGDALAALKAALVTSRGLGGA